MIQQYKVAIKYTVYHIDDMTVYADSEEQAIEIAKFAFPKTHTELYKFESAKVIP